MKLLKFEPKKVENSVDAIKEGINGTDWQCLFAFGFLENGDLFYTHSEYSVYELIGMMETVKKQFIEANED